MDIQAKFTLLKAAILALQLGGIHDECRWDIPRCHDKYITSLMSAGSGTGAFMRILFQQFDML
jgi:hypothetical protein